jgi:hypothetical protein
MGAPTPIYDDAMRVKGPLFFLAFFRFPVSLFPTATFVSSARRPRWIARALAAIGHMVNIAR